MCYPFIYCAALTGRKNVSSLESDTATHTLMDTNLKDNSLLSAQESLPIINFGERGLVTADLAQPPSVAEHTTKLLKDLSEQR